MFNLDNLKEESLDAYIWGGVPNLHKVTPEYFFDCAVKDIEDGTSERHLANAISNAKKALHLRAEELCGGLGVFKIRTRNFPYLIEYLSKCGIIAPRILLRINKLRNKVEHDFYIPTLEEVENFIDITQLFLESTRKWMERLPREIEIVGEVLDESKSYFLVNIVLDWKIPALKLHYADKNSNQPGKTHILKPDEELYFKVSRMVFRNRGAM